MASDENLQDRLKGLEVKINGNGNYGLEDKVSSNSDKIDILDEKLDEVKLKMVTKDMFDDHIDGEENRLDRLESRIVDRVDQKIKERSRYWLRYLGPTLTGIAAILAVLFGDKV